MPVQSASHARLTLAPAMLFGLAGWTLYLHVVRTVLSPHCTVLSPEAAKSQLFFWHFIKSSVQPSRPIRVGTWSCAPGVLPFPQVLPRPFSLSHWDHTILSDPPSWIPCQFGWLCRTIAGPWLQPCYNLFIWTAHQNMLLFLNRGKLNPEIATFLFPVLTWK